MHIGPTKVRLRSSRIGGVHFTEASARHLPELDRFTSDSLLFSTLLALERHFASLCRQFDGFVCFGSEDQVFILVFRGSGEELTVCLLQLLIELLV